MMRKYFILQTSNYAYITDFSSTHSLKDKGVLENSPCCLRRNIDDTKFILKIGGDVIPDWFHTDDKTPYTLAEILIEMAKAEWAYEV